MPRWIVAAISLTLAAGVARAEDPKGTYDKMCASCHGADGHGNAAKAKTLKIEPSLMDLGREAAKGMSRDEKRKILVDGKAKMPAYAKKVAAAEIDPLLDYSLGLVAGKAAPAAPAPSAAPKPAPKPAADAAPATPAPAAGAAAAPAAAPGGPSTATKTLWTKRCASCHGPDGAGNAKMAKKLKIEPALLDLGREATADLSRGDLAAIIRTGKDKMPAFAKKLKGAQIMALTDHTFTLASERRAKK